jgi:hypothetical protein
MQENSRKEWIMRLVAKSLSVLLLLMAGWIATAPLGAAAAAQIMLLAEGPTASEDGDVGVFFVFREDTGTNAFTVKYSIQGTASNGVDYVTISNSVLMRANEYYARVLVRPLADATPETNKTVTLNLTPDAAYTFVGPTNATVVLRRLAPLFSRDRHF